MNEPWEHCSICKAKLVDGEFNTCDKCLEEITADDVVSKTCPNCGAPVTLGSTLCWKCEMLEEGIDDEKD